MDSFRGDIILELKYDQNWEGEGANAPFSPYIFTLKYTAVNKLDRISENPLQTEDPIYYPLQILGKGFIFLLID